MLQQSTRLWGIGTARRLPPVALCAGAVAFWIVVVGLTTLFAVMRGYQYRWINLPLDLFLVCWASLVCMGLTAALGRVEGGTGRKIALSGALSLLFALPLFAGFSTATLFLGPNAQENTVSSVFAPDRALIGWLFWIGPLCLWSAGCLFVLQQEESRARERQLAALRAEAHGAQIRALRYQINPHFLYNTLNSISALILEGRTADADAMVLRLSAFFRASLSLDPLQDVPLAREMELQRLYLDIEQVRFGNELEIVYDVPDALGDALVPSLILQPLVENAIKHGMREHGQITRLFLCARAAGKSLILEVVDNGPGTAKPGGTGVGLANVERRLVTRFGESARFAAGPRPQGGYCVRLGMPLLLPS